MSTTETVDCVCRSRLHLRSDSLQPSSTWLQSALNIVYKLGETILNYKVIAVQVYGGTSKQELRTLKLGDLISAIRTIVGARSTQWLGQMSDTSLQQLSENHVQGKQECFPQPEVQTGPHLKTITVQVFS